MRRDPSHKVIFDDDSYIGEDVMNEIKEGLREANPDADEETIEQWAQEAPGEDLDCDRANLSHLKIPNGILCLGYLGRWWAINGTPRPLFIPSYDLKDIPECMQYHADGPSDLYIYVDTDGELCIDETDHDGTSSYMFRAWLPNVTEDEKDDLRYKLMSQGTFDKEELNRMTVRVGDWIGDVFGWDFPNRPEAAFIQKA